MTAARYGCIPATLTLLPEALLKLQPPALIDHESLALRVSQLVTTE